MQHAHALATSWRRFRVSVATRAARLSLVALATTASMSSTARVAPIALVGSLASSATAASPWQRPDPGRDGAPTRPGEPTSIGATTTPVAEIARIPLRVVDGRLVVGCQLAAKKRIACNLFVDFDAPVGLLLHNKAADGIEAEEEDGRPNPITIYLPDVNVNVYQREVGDEKLYDDFTKWWSKELGENAVVGTIGARILSRYHVTFDLPNGFLELSAPHARVPELPPAGPGSFLAPLTVVNELVWLKVGFGDHRGGALAIATSRHDTVVDRDLCDELERPAGDVGPVRMGDVDLATFVAFRPEDVRHVHPDGVFGATGLNLLSYFRVEIDRVNGFARFTQARPAEFPVADLEYFRARAEGSPEALEIWLDAHPTERLAAEASKRLLDKLVRAGSDGARVRKAMERIAKTTPEDLQATGALALVQAMLAAGKPEYALTAGALGLDGARKDRYPDAVHKLHARMGDVLLEKGERHEAWKHLLSAAFGMPDDGPLNLSLARYYEAESRYTRAFSRYLVALLSPDSGSEAIEGLQRVVDRVPDAEAFSVDSVERLIAGKVQGFGVAARFEPREGRTYTRTVLSELYTCAHSKGEIGVTLARDGLRDFFPRDRLVLVTYHVPSPEMDPLVNPLSLRQWEDFAESEEAAHRFDDVEPAPPAGLVKHKEQIFEMSKKITLDRLDEDSEHEIAITASVDARGIRGHVTVKGPAAEDDLVQILLVERGALFPGKSKVVIHHDVARASLTRDLAGAAYEPKDGSMTIDFDRAWADIQAENDAFLTRREAEGGARMPRFSTRVDPRQARVVAIVRVRENGRVLQCAQLDPELPEDMR